MEPGDGNAPPVVSNQAETVPSTTFRSPESPSSDGSSDSPGYLIHNSMLTEDVDWRNPEMVHGDGYDPNRIPASIFSSQPSSSDWSTASNESLFSIYMGNSFSAYQGLIMSEDLSKIEELYNSQNHFESKANEGRDFSPNLPALPETPPELETRQSENIKDDITIQKGQPKISTAVKEETKKNHGNKTSPEENMADLTISSSRKRLDEFEKTNSIQNRLSDASNQSCSSKNRLSDDSDRSCGSFAFPVLVADADKSCSFRTRSDKRVEPPKKQQFEPPRTTAPAEAPRTTAPAEVPQTKTPPVGWGRGCLSLLPAWKCC